MSLKNYEVAVRKEDEPIDLQNADWHVKVRAESPSDALELGNQIFRLAMSDFDPDDYYFHAFGPQ
ncbi:MAG: hypothetical protein WD795_18940 [Woeseia sp.]